MENKDFLLDGELWVFTDGYYEQAEVIDRIDNYGSVPLFKFIESPLRLRIWWTSANAYSHFTDVEIPGAIDIQYAVYSLNEKLVTLRASREEE